jgi:hypothetical protein
MAAIDAKKAVCRDPGRKADVREHPTRNGIDFVEYFEDRSALPAPLYWLEVNFLRAAPAGLVGAPAAFSVSGGVRISGIRVVDVAAGPEATRILAYFDQPGDFSTYVLAIDSTALDPELAAVPFTFKPHCPSPFDCRREPDCPPDRPEEPVLDYLAKDYASFRRLLLDLIATRNPDWIERNPADLGIALAELFAYAGDNLSYFQDAVATESYLDTCRHRVSARRHARLVDYAVHDGRNAWTHVHFEVNAAGNVPQGTRLLTRVIDPLIGQAVAPGAMIASTVAPQFEADPALRSVEVFETTARIRTSPLSNLLYIHTFGDARCCLPSGARRVFVYSLTPGPAPLWTAILPPLAAGDYLLLEEVKGPATGFAADADPRHRQVVRITGVRATEDPIYLATLDGPGRLRPIAAPPPPGTAVLPLLEVTWDEADALTFALCLSSRDAGTGEPISDVSVARGNVAPCDHGRTVVETFHALEDNARLYFLPAGTDPQAAPVPAVGRTGVANLALTRSPLTVQAMPTTPTYDDDGRLRQPRHALGADVRSCAPAVVLVMQFPAAETEIWEPVPSLLASRAFDRHFVAEVDNAGMTALRFGDDEYGRRPLEVQTVTARYRIGNGRAGNIGAGALIHVIEPAAAEMSDPADPTAAPGVFPGVVRVWQPLSATMGTDAESIEVVRQQAPRAFHAEQFRAVTEGDWEQAAMKLAGIAAVKATFRWTGSWHTVFMALHPADLNDLVTEPGGRTRLSDALAARARSHLTRYKLAGYDLEIRTARYVPLEIALQVCVARGHFRGDVLEAVAGALSNRRNADGSVGFFHPTRLSFGQSVYLSQVYAAVKALPGVDSLVISVFERYWEQANQELETGVIEMGPWEIARLDNDRSFPEFGTLTITAVGGL